MICPDCQATIDDDSFFCDQCGKEIRICSFCGKPGKGKWCTIDGKKMIPRKEESKSSQVQTLLLLKPKDGQPALRVKNTVLLGRSEGDFISFFQSSPAISRRHASIEKQQDSWYVKDLGSTNGTRINSRSLFVKQPVQLSSGDSLSLADVEFTVEITRD